MNDKAKYLAFEDFTNYDTKTGMPTSVDPELIKRENEIKLRELKKYEEGKLAGHEAGYDAKEHEISEQLASIENEINRSFSKMSEAIEEIREKTRINAADLAITIINILIPATVKKYPYNEIEKLVSDCMLNVETDYNLTVFVAIHIQEKLDKRLHQISIENGFKGSIIVRGDENLNGTDCKIEWPEGGIIRDIDKVIKEMNSLLERRNLTNRIDAKQINNIDDAIKT